MPKANLLSSLCERCAPPEITLKLKPCGEIVKEQLQLIEARFPSVTVEDYVIMPDHIHAIIILTGDHTGSPLQEIVNWYKTMTTNEYIRHVKEGLYQPYNDAFWQRSFFDHIIRNQDDLYETRKYIVNNPISWYFDHKK